MTDDTVVMVVTVIKVGKDGGHRLATRNNGCAHRLDYKKKGERGKMSESDAGEMVVRSEPGTGEGGEAQ